jgi:transcriptional regulator with XRE-family HTH domain
MNELARQASISSAHMSNVLNEKQKPGFDFCIGVARALGVPEIEVFQRAGLLSPAPPTDTPALDTLLREAARLSAARQEELLRLARAMVTMERAEREGET